DRRYKGPGENPLAESFPCSAVRLPVKEQAVSQPRRTPDGEPSGTSFVAIDFETADHGRDSACAVALVRVEELRIVGLEFCLLRPPRRQFVFSYLHGITWQRVATQPTFAEA